jgi:hypothetical protein
MATRQAKSVARRQAHHQAKLDAAPDPRSRFWVACNALAAAARRVGRFDEATELVLTAVDTIRNGDQT